MTAELVIGVIGLLGTVGSIWLWYLNAKKKTKIEKAREIIVKNRAKKAKERHNAQVRDTDEMEKDHDNLMADVLSVLGVRGEADKAD